MTSKRLYGATWRPREKNIKSIIPYLPARIQLAKRDGASIDPGN
jgi:hypothetical protein